MAKVKLSAVVSEMRNKLNGSVFSRNRGGAYLRTKVTPTNPQTAAQVAARALLTQFSQSWRSLTETERESWRSVVDQWATTDVFGDVVNPSGSTLYTRLNINIQLAGGVEITVPPTPTGAAAITELSLVANTVGDVFDITFLPDPVPASHAMFIESTPMVSPGIANANSKFRHIVTAAAAEVSPFDAFADQVAKFGSLVAGQKAFVRAKFIRLDTGETSQRLVNNTIVL